MINFKITYSKNPTRLLDTQENIETLIQKDKCLIEGSKPLHQWKNISGDSFIVIGTLVGIRQADGSLSSASLISLNSDLFEQPGKLEQLEGRFVVIKLSADGACEVWTDQFGKIDVYYQSGVDEVVIASNLGFLPVSRGRWEIDQMAAAHSLTIYGSRPAKKHTFYKGVSRLGVNEILCLVNGRVELIKRPFTPADIVEYKERELHRYADIFLEGIRARASTELNIVSLSSGWDSTSILAALVHLFGNRKVRCVIARLKYSERSGIINPFELERAKAIADYFAVPLDIIDYDFGINGRKYLNEAREVLRANQLMSISALGNYLIYKHVAKNYPEQDKVFFTGEGSDGAHNLGFSQFVTMFHPGSYEFREYADKMGNFLYGPTFLKELYAGDHECDPVWKLIKGKNPENIFDEPAKAPSVINKQILSSLFLRNDRTPFYSLKNARILTPEGREAYSQESEQMYFGETNSFGPSNLYSWYLHLYNSFYWQASPTIARDRMADIHGVKIAHPFQDSALIDFLSAMPESWGRGLNLNPTKYPLKWMLNNRFDYPTHLQVGPHSYIYDVQRGFSISGELLHASDLKNVFANSLESRNFLESLDSRVFDVNYINGIVKSYLGGTELRGEEAGDIFQIATHSAVGVYGN
jgi:asparagine synthetase B (glutamine-hydrolysing)